MEPEVGRPLRFRQRFIRSWLDWVMLAILQRKPSYGNELITVISDEFGLYVSPGSLYPILYELERGGFISSTWEQPDRKTKRVYGLTERGQGALRDGFETLIRLLASFQLVADGPAAPPRTVAQTGGRPRGDISALPGQSGLGSGDSIADAFDLGKWILLVLRDET